MFTKFILTIMQTRNVDIVEFNIWHKSFDKCRNIFLKVIPQVNTRNESLLWEQACLLVLFFLFISRMFQSFGNFIIAGEGLQSLI